MTLIQNVTLCILRQCTMFSVIKAYVRIKWNFPLFYLFTLRFYSYGIDVDELGQIQLCAQRFKNIHSQNIHAESSARYEVSTIHA